MDSFGEIIEILASLLGILFYFFLTARKRNKKKAPPQNTAPQPTRKAQPVLEREEQDAFEEEKDFDMERYYQEEPVAEQRETQGEISFKELLEQFTNPTSREVKKVQEIEEEPEIIVNKPLISNREQSIERTISKDYTQPRIIPDSPKVEIKLKDYNEEFSAYKKKQKEINKYAAMLKNPQTLKELLIAKEIFDRKHF